MRSIVTLAATDADQSSRVLDADHELTAYDCYERALMLFHERCFDITKVSRSSVLNDSL